MFRIELWRPRARFFSKVVTWEKTPWGVETDSLSHADEQYNHARAELRDAPAGTCVVLYKDDVEIARRSDPLPLAATFTKRDPVTGRALFTLPVDACVEEDCNQKGPHTHLVVIEQMSDDEIAAMDDVSLYEALRDSVSEGYPIPVRAVA